MCRLISELGIVKQAHSSFMFFSITSSEKFRFLSLILNVFNIDLHIGALPFFLFCLVANNYRGNCAILYFKHKIGLMIFSHQSNLYRTKIKGTGQNSFRIHCPALLRMTKTEKLNKSFHLGQLMRFSI